MSSAGSERDGLGPEWRIPHFITRVVILAPRKPLATDLFGGVRRRSLWTPESSGCRRTNVAKNEKTGKAAGTSASKTLRGTGTPTDAKRAAASALSQRPDKGGKKK